jgi:hypothetical protein
MVAIKNHKTIDVRNEDIKLLDDLRITKYGKISYSEIFHIICNFWRENNR